MISSPDFQPLAVASDEPVQQTWLPPPLLLEVASGDDSLIPDLIEVFNADTDARMRRLRAALASCDFAAIRVEAHTIKGGARQIGAASVADACQELEEACRLQDSALVSVRLNLLEELFDCVRREMAAYCRHRSGTV